ncbi:MAG: plasmid recombination protein [Lachnospiraceae bacterium]|jgi:hypothetical protein|nr:plasmid recombination protein [Lachnospiraceae bacterium]
MGYNIGMPCMKLNNAGNTSKHCGSFGGVAMEALEERKGRDPDINPELSYLNQSFGFTTAKQLLAYSDEHVVNLTRSLHEEGKRGVRRDAVRMIVTIFKPPGGLMDALEEEEQKELLSDCLEEFTAIVGADRIKAASIHFDELSPHIHVFWEPMTEDGRLCAKEVLNLKMYQTINKEMPKRLRERGWDMIDDCNCYDAEKEAQLSAKEREQHYKERAAKNGRSSARFKAEASRELVDLQEQMDELSKNKMKILDEPEVKEAFGQLVHKGILAKTKVFLLEHVLPKINSLIMYDVIDATLEFLDKKGLLKDKHEAVNELYGAGKDGTHIISEEVQERLKDEIEHDMVCGMMEEPEFGVQRGRHGRLR